MKIDILTIFPEMFAPLEYSIIERAREKGIITIDIHNIRDFSLDKHKKVDDYPYGGGSGMVMAPDPLYRAVEHVMSRSSCKPRVLLMSPGGSVFNQTLAKELSREEQLIFICGHYEGIDERIMPLVNDEISIGDYVLTGGELASMVIIDSTCRMISGVLSSSSSYEDESFYGNLLEYPQYTRPVEYRGMRVPEILLSGHHENVRIWRRYQSLKKTLGRRPEIIDHKNLTEEDKKLLCKIEQEKGNV